jgi:putative FmdB family regulatory protein
MPTYEYECTKCAFRFEEFQRITDKPLKHCPKCNGMLRRVISGGIGIIFKGSGFYVTDYKKPRLPQKADKKKKDLTVQKDTSKTSPSKDSSEKKKQSDST